MVPAQNHSPHSTYLLSGDYRLVRKQMSARLSILLFHLFKSTEEHILVELLLVYLGLHNNHHGGPLRR